MSLTKRSPEVLDASLIRVRQLACHNNNELHEYCGARLNAVDNKLTRLIETWNAIDVFV